jgi:hypothetical protein
MRQRQHPLPHRHPREDVVHHVRSAFRHAPPPAARTARSGLARKRDQPVETTVVATETGEAAGQPAAAQELAEFPPPPRLRRGSPERCARRRPARRTGAVLLRRADRPPGRGTSQSDRGPPDTAHPAKASAARTPSRGRPRHARRIPGATRPDSGRLRKSGDRVRCARSSCRSPGPSVRRFCRAGPPGPSHPGHRTRIRRSRGARRT